MNKKILSFGFAIAMAAAMIVSCVKKEDNTIKTNIVTKSTSTAPGTTSGATTSGSTTGHTPVVVPCLSIPKDVVHVTKPDQSGFTFNDLTLSSVGHNIANNHLQFTGHTDQGDQVTVRFADTIMPKFDSVFVAASAADCDNLISNQVCVTINLNSSGTPYAFTLAPQSKVYITIDKVTNLPDVYICGDASTSESFQGAMPANANGNIWCSVQMNVTN
jgi:hypothetical protein